MASRYLPISVIIPIHNHERYIRDCLESIKNADQLPLEVILVDNASSDGSVLLAQRTELPNLSIIRNSANLGATRARSIGVDRAKSDLIVFLDSDDYFGPNALRKALNALEKYQLDVSLFDVIRVTEDTSKVLPFVDAPRHVIDGIEAFSLTLGGWRIHTCMLLKKALYLRALQGFKYFGHSDDEVLSRRVLLLADRIGGSEGVYYYRTVLKRPNAERILSQVRTNLSALAMGVDLADRLSDDRPLRAMRNVVTRNLMGLTVRAACADIRWSDVRKFAEECDALRISWGPSDRKYRIMDALVRAALRLVPAADRTTTCR